jgi:DNA-binding beta-propeller fold protein YncE
VTACDNSGNVYVTDTNNHHIQVFTAEGGYLRQFGHGKGNGKLNSPTGIAIDSDNVAYVTEYRNFSVLVFTCEGKFLMLIGTEGSGPGQFYHPYRITVVKDVVVHVCQ